MKVALIGYGKMGSMVERLAGEEGIEIAARYDIDTPLDSDDNAKGTLEDVSILIDFTQPEAVPDTIRAAALLGKNLVIGTTGWHDFLPEAKKIVRNAGTGLVYGANFSLGVRIFYRLVERAGSLFKHFPEYDPYITEAHHRFKKDAPSGTALTLKSILERHTNRKGPEISSVRAGHIPGTHRVGFDSTVDTVELVHRARSREGFARGALLAARWIEGRKGFFEFGEVVDSLID